MSELTLNAEQVQAWAEQLLMWVGFGTVVGLVARAIMPGRDPGGAIATLLMGVGGSLIGGGILSYFAGREATPTPISIGGFLLAVGGAFLLLFFYRLFRGSHVGRDRVREPYFRRRRRRPEILELDGF